MDLSLCLLVSKAHLGVAAVAAASLGLVFLMLATARFLSLHLAQLFRHEAAVAADSEAEAAKEREAFEKSLTRGTPVIIIQPDNEVRGSVDVQIIILVRFGHVCYEVHASR